MAVQIDEQTLFDQFLHYGLLVGALFQFVCIFAVIVLPRSKDDQFDDSPSSEGRSSQGIARPSDSSRRGKKEKKKHR